MVKDLFQRAMAAFKAGRKDESRSLFMDIVEQDAQHEQAWLYLSALVDSLEEQQICLENVLTINPDNAKAQQGMAKLQQRLSGQQKMTPPPAPEPDEWANFAEPTSFTPNTSAASPFGDSPPIGAEFGGQDDDLFGTPTFGQQDADTTSGFGSDFDFNTEDTPDTVEEANDPFSWLNDTPAQPSISDSPPATSSASPPPAADSDEFSFSASSVDWGSDDQPATYGSGRQIDEPTADEYDSWMDNLPLGTETAAVDSGDDEAESAFGATPFGDTSFMVENDSYADDDIFGQDASGGQSGDSFWDAAPSDDAFAAFGAQDVADDPGPRNTSESGSDDLFDAAGGFADDELDTFRSSVFDDVDDDAGSAAYFDDPEPISSEDGFDFSFDDDDNDAAAALEARLNDVTASPITTSQVAPQKAVPSVNYFSLIPPEIAPYEGGASSRTMLLVGGIVIMVALNIVSILLLIM